MTSQALNHTAIAPNHVSPDGKMSHDKKLAFVQQMAKHGLQHLDAGGVAGPTTIGGPGVVNTGAGSNGITGSVGNALGLYNQFQAQGAPVQAGTNAEQINNAYYGAQNALGQQQNIANTLQPGVAQGANAQANLSQQLINESNGQGPNPAQAAYQQNVQNLAKQQAGAIASTKGISPALQARLISEQGSAAGQNAAGQAATLAAQQQLAAQNNLQNLSAQQVAQGAGAVQGNNNAQQNEQNILQGANTAYNNAAVGIQSNLNNVNAQTAIANQNQSSNIAGGLINGIGSVLGGLFAHGGEVKKPAMMADGGLMIAPTNGPQSLVGNWLNSSVNTSAPSIAATPSFNTTIANPFQSKGGGKPKPGGSGIAGGGDMSSVMVGGAGDAATSGGIMEAVGANPELLAMAAKGGKVSAKGGNQKAVVAGDDLKNDKIPAMLSEGEVVIDRETLNDPGPVGKAARSVASAIAARNKARGKK